MVSYPELVEGLDHKTKGKNMDREKHVDESWKESVAGEKESLIKGTDPAEHSHGDVSADDLGAMEVNFVNYVTSLAFQALIFLGEIPNPMADNKIEQNLPQAKFLIDTLSMLRDKTKGNLTKDEEDLLSASVYELQMKFVEHSQSQAPKTGFEQR